MLQSTTCRPPNSVILIQDRDESDLPESLGEGLVTATSTCLVVGTLCFADGETSLTLSDETGLPSTSVIPHVCAFDGTLDLPSGQLVVSTVEDVTILEMKHPGQQARVTVWVNDESEPDSIWIQVTR